MTTLCHQCRQSIPEGAVYCPECGAPQLRVRPPEVPDGESAPEPPQQHAGEIVWPAAVSATALFAIPAGLLLTLREGRGLPEILWIVGGTLLALRRYRKTAPRAPKLTARLGGRIGLMLGLFAAATNFAAEAVRLLIERYGLHHGGAIDARLHSFAQLEVDLIKTSSPDTVASLGWLTKFWLSPEGSATLLILSLSASAVFVLFLGWLTGRFAVKGPGSLRRRQAS